MYSRLASYYQRFGRVELPTIGFWPRRTKPAQRRALLRLIAAAQEEHLPLIPLLEARLEEERGMQRRRLRNLLRRLHDGTPLADAVEQVPGVLNDEDVLTIRFGMQSGILAPAIRASLAEPNWLTPRAQTETRKAVPYLVVMLILGSLVFAFQQSAIVPQLLRICEDFGVEPNAALRAVQTAGDVLIGLSWLIPLVAVLVLWLTFSTGMGRRVRRALAGGMFRWPREWRAAEVLQRLEIAAHAGRPLPGALSTLARYHYDQTIRHKLLDIRNEIEQGADLWESFADVELLTEAEVEAMQSADSLNQRDWVLSQLTAGCKRRLMRRVEAVSHFYTPLTVFFVAAIVLLQGLALFLAMAHLIYQV